ncbi:MAG TPA: 30S ribosomal protein S12 methylthiotransferase RimO [Bacteroidales bacterium]|nr:30S ribosomal protein S12 methylthiotransferase RimO [Bacteroidales bacterium]HPM39377.1 30S ribosomal protein S12 methylthiotransferase RimO [Bacteroidales bacterium]
MSKKSISIVTLGCPKNQVDSEKLAAALSSAFIVEHEKEVADYIIINTCSFILPAKEETINTILDYIDLKKQGLIEKIIVTGCMAQLYKKDLLDNLPDIDMIFGLSEYENLVKTLTDNQNVNITNDRILSTPNHYAYLKIADGCDHSCSFCTIPMIRGAYKSIPMEELINEAKNLANKGVKELILIAQDTTYYGIDIYHKQKLPELLDTLASLNLFSWIRLLYTYPINFPMELIDVYNAHKSIVPYIHLPLQHCDDKILENMRRPFGQEAITNLINILRTSIADLAIRTDFIAGYPLETNKEFNKLKNFIKEMNFERMGIFEYSIEENTPAALLTQHGDKLKVKRTQELMDIYAELSISRNRSLIGKNLKVIIDDKLDDNLYEARSQWDAPEIDQVVFVNSNIQLQRGQIVDVHINDAGNFDLSGDLVTW